MLESLLRVSIAVRDLDAAVATYVAMGLERLGDVKESPRGLGLRWVELGRDGRAFVELLTPTREDAPLARYLERHGEGVYQVRFGTADLPSTLDELEARGLRVVRDQATGQGLRPLGWVHPTSTHGVLVELVQDAQEE